MLIEADELRQLIESSGEPVVILDIRSQDQFRHGTLPGAKRVGGFLDYRWLFDSDGKVQEPGRADSSLYALFGTREPTRVVLCGESLDPTVARAWWQLRYSGIEGATVLNGGWRAWQEINGPIEEPPKYIVGHGPGLASVFKLEPQAPLLVEGNALRRRLAAGESPTLIDARSEREHAAGCLPGAKRLEWSELVDAPTGKLLPADKLRAKFQGVGIDPLEPTITYCRTGGRASVTVLALAALGSTEAANYYGGWTEWKASEAALPAETTP